MVKYAICFGAGKESCELVKRFKKYKPLLLTVLGEEDSVAPQVIHAFARDQKLACKVKQRKEGFKDYYSLEEVGDSFKVTEYENPFTDYAKKHGLTLVSGRRRTDLVERTQDPEDKRRYATTPAPKIDGVVFPMWYE